MMICIQSINLQTQFRNINIASETDKRNWGGKNVKNGYKQVSIVIQVFIYSDVISISSHQQQVLYEIYKEEIV